MAINQSKHIEKTYTGEKNQTDGQVDIFKFDRTKYSFVNGIKDDKDYLIIAKKGVLDQMAEDATQDPENAKRVDSKQPQSGYWQDANGNLRHPGDGLGDDTPLGSARQEFINTWSNK